MTPNPPIPPALPPTPEEILASARPFEIRPHYILMVYDEAKQVLRMVKQEQLDALQGRLYVFHTPYEAPLLPPPPDHP